MWKQRENHHQRSQGRLACILFDGKYRVYRMSEWFYYQSTLLQFWFDMQTDHFVSQLPFTDITNAALDSWKQDRLTDTETSLTGAITNSRNQSHHALANRALVRARLRDWDLAFEDATNVSFRSFLRAYVHFKSLQVHQDLSIR